MPRAALLAASALLPSCAHLFMPGAVADMEHAYNGEPVVHVHRADALRGLKKLIVPDFRVVQPGGVSGREEMFKGSPAEGVGYYGAQDYGVTLAEFFEEALLRLPGMDVLERNRLKRLVREQAVQMSGLVDAAIGEPSKFEGADGLLLGTITTALWYQPNDPSLPGMEMVALHLRLLDIRTGGIVLVYRDRRMVSGTFVDEDALLEELAKRFAQRLQAERSK